MQIPKANRIYDTGLNVGGAISLVSTLTVDSATFSVGGSVVSIDSS